MTKRATFEPVGELAKRLLGTSNSSSGFIPQVQNKVYGKAIKHVGLDTDQLAVTSYLDKDLITNAVKMIFQAIADICLACNDLVLDMGFIKIDIINKRLKFIYSEEILKVVTSEKFEREVERVYQDS